MRKYLKFSEVKVGETFNLNGNTYVKKSTRTGHLIEFNRRFYIGQNETVTVEG